MAHLKAGGLNVVAPPIAESFDPQLLIMLIEYDAEFGLTWDQANDDTLLMTALEKKAKHDRKDAPDVRSILDKADLTAGFSTNIEAQITCDMFKNYLILREKNDMKKWTETAGGQKIVKKSMVAQIPHPVLKKKLETAFEYDELDEKKAQGKTWESGKAASETFPVSLDRERW